MSESRGISVSVIVCTLDREADLALTVSSLLDQTELPEELVVVDAGRSSGVRNRLERQIGDALSLVYARTSAGLTLQRNTGVRMASGQLILFLDDDVYLAADFIQVVKRVFSGDNDKKIQAVQCCIINQYEDAPAVRIGPLHVPSVPITSLIHRTIAHVFLLPTKGDGSIKASGFQARAADDRAAGLVEALSGCACFRKSAFRDIAFDEALEGYGWMEDVDVSRQLKARGLRAYYEPQAILLHRNSPAARTGSVALGRMVIDNHAYLFRKHRSGRPFETAAFLWSCIGLVMLALLRLDLRKAYGMLASAGIAVSSACDGARHI